MGDKNPEYLASVYLVCLVYLCICVSCVSCICPCILLSCVSCVCALASSLYLPYSGPGAQQQLLDPQPRRPFQAYLASPTLGLIQQRRGGHFIHSLHRTDRLLVDGPENRTPACDVESTLQTLIE